jgi:hypothetical protein
VERHYPAVIGAALIVFTTACAQNHPESPTAPSAPQPIAAPAAFVLTGVVKETAPASRSLSGVQLQVTGGPGAGTTVTSDPNGVYRLTVPGGVAAIEARRDGYFVWRIGNLTVDKDYPQLDVTLYPSTPTNTAGASATARCNDGSWSWAPSRADACVANGGIAYTTCPGALCLSSSVE